MEFILMFSGLFCAVPVVIAGMAALIFVLVRGMGGIFRSVSGWDELARRFPGPPLPPSQIQSTSIRLGNVFYRYGARLGITSEGLYLAFTSVYKNPPVFIPWHEFNNPQPSILYWQPAQRLDIGFPMIWQLTVKETQYQQMKPYLGNQTK